MMITAVLGRLVGKFRLWGCLSALLIMFAACDVHEFPQDEPTLPSEPQVPVKCIIDLRFMTGSMPLYTTITYDPDSPDGIKPRSGSEGSFDFRYFIEIQDAERNKSDMYQSMILTTSDLENLDRRIEVELPPGSYHVLGWGDYVKRGSSADFYYDTSDMRSICVMGDSDGRHPGNNDTRDAFRGETVLDVSAERPQGAGGKPVDEIITEVWMKRPMARFRFVTTDVGEFISRMSGSASSSSSKTHPESVLPDLGDYRVVVRYTGYMPSVYNAYTDKPVDSALGRWFDGHVRKIDDHSAELAFDQVFVNGSETTVQVALEVYSRHGGAKVAATRPIEVPVVRGKLTEIRGPFLTTNTSGGVGIHPGFNGDFNIEIK